MDAASATFSPDDFTNQSSLSMQAHRPREKSKRPQLSCNPCRARKVKVGHRILIMISLAPFLMIFVISVIEFNPVLHALCIRLPTIASSILQKQSGIPFCKPRLSKTKTRPLLNFVMRSPPCVEIRSRQNPSTRSSPSVKADPRSNCLQGCRQRKHRHWLRSVSTLER